MKKTLLALVAAFAAVGAQAAVSTASANIGLTDTDFTLGLALSALTPAVPAGATVNSAALTFSGSFLSTLTALNTSNTSSNVFSRTSNLNLDLLFNGSSLGGLSLAIWNVPNTTLGVSGGGSDFRDFGSSTGSDSVTINSSDAGLLAALSAGTGNFQCDAFVQSSGRDGGGNVRVVQATQAACGLSVALDYTAAPPPAVPEPGSLALVGLALAGVAAASRRKA